MVLVIRPNVFGALKFTAGGLKLGWFRKLKNSARKSTYLLPESGNFLPSDTSRLKYFGARTIPTPASPKVPGAGMGNAVSSSHGPIFWFAGLPSPIRLGRAAPRGPCNETSVAVTVIGNPECQETMPRIFHPPITPALT